jgi:hypothetical protein
MGTSKVRFTLLAVCLTLLITLSGAWICSVGCPRTYSRDSDSGDLRHDSESHLLINIEDGVVSMHLQWWTVPVRVSELEHRPSSGIKEVSSTVQWAGATGDPFGMDHQFMSFGYSYSHERSGLPDVPYDDTLTFEPSQVPLTATDVGFSFPIWAPLLVVVAVLIVDLGNRRSGRGRNSLCRACGYDLRTTPNRCPECGNQPVPGAETGIAPRKLAKGE